MCWLESLFFLMILLNETFCNDNKKPTRSKTVMIFIAHSWVHLIDCGEIMLQYASVESRFCLQNKKHAALHVDFFTLSVQGSTAIRQWSLECLFLIFGKLKLPWKFSLEPLYEYSLWVPSEPLYGYFLYYFTLLYNW
jgi:hypothetical protein